MLRVKIKNFEFPTLFKVPQPLILAKLTKKILVPQPLILAKLTKNFS